MNIDRLGKKVTHVNYTTNVASGPFSYAAVPAATANGFSILNKAIVNANNDYVLFSEFPGVALVYQMFNSNGTASGWPVYVVIKASPSAADYYGQAYNWMKFYIDQAAAASDMECGFAAFDTAATGGLLYGAGYSNRIESEDVNPAISNINGNAVSIAAFTWNATMKAFIKYDTAHSGDMNYALTLTGTPSGTAVLDFGPLQNQGGALAIPQAGSKAFSSNYVGTYFAIMYEYDKTGAGTRNVRPIKVVLANPAAPTVSVFNYTEKTTGTAIFTSTLQALEDFPNGPNKPGPAGTPVCTQFQTASGNTAATSTVVKNAHLCHGSFIAASGNFVLVITFDPSGRFCSYTMFDSNGGDATNDIIRFGFAIKDAGYTNSY